MSDVEILSIGDELLRGIVQDTNTHWLACRIAARGARLRRAALLPDEPGVVAAALREALSRGPALVVTQGGLGPTDDDRTRRALALALGVPLEPHPEAERIVRRRFEELARAGAVAGAEMVEARLRMSRLPRGALALDNRVGTAPGVVLTAGPTTIVSLPGVPPELRWIWENPLSPILDRVLGPGGFAEVTVTLELRDESRIAPLLALVQASHPDVYVKSRATGHAEGEEVRATLAAFGTDDSEAGERVSAAYEALRAALAAERIAIRG
ncbi:MAG: competence/damage-inducible protein A [Acidobacteria bacterium]|nr:competence/damage-inducible protein A [Acidobacteriota bacterium]